MRMTLAAALATAMLAGGVVMATNASAFGPGPGGFAPGGGGPPPPGPGFGGPGGFANPQPPGGGGGGGAWLPPGGGWGGWGGSFGLTIAPTIIAPQPRAADPWRAHVAWCLKRWKTYDPDTDMYNSSDGPRYCVSPMSPYLQ